MFPVLTPEDLQEALTYAAWWLDEQDAPATNVETSREIPQYLKPVPKPTASDILKASQEPITPQPEAPAEAEAEAEDAPDPTESNPEEFADENEIMELFHPAFPDKPTVVFSRNGIFDARWEIPTIAWYDIRGIQRVSGEKAIHIVLRNPEHYLASMPFFKQIQARIKLMFNMLTLHLDTSSLGVRTRDMYLEASRLWVNYRGDVRFRKKRRVKLTERTIRSEKIED